MRDLICAECGTALRRKTIDGQRIVFPCEQCRTHDRIIADLKELKRLMDARDLAMERLQASVRQTGDNELHYDKLNRAIIAEMRHLFRVYPQLTPPDGQ